MKNKAESSHAIRIGLVADEPIRVAGLATIFDQPAAAGRAQLIPVIGSLQDLLAMSAIEYIVIDLQASPGGLEVLEVVRQSRPSIRLIVIGPEGDEELILSSIIAGARAYLGLSAGPTLVRQAIEVVTSGSIWAPRYLLSRLIDRLLKVPETRPKEPDPKLTRREEQVLELILLARSTREIATQLGIEQRTVKAYVGRLLKKTGADNRIQLSMSALNQSLLHKDTGRRGSTSVTKR
jgi:DNA-binding NarL/FixJ family response regulator